MARWRYSVSAAVNTPLTAPLPLEGDICEVLKTASKLGYEGVEIHTRETAKLDIEGIKEAIKSTKVKIVNIVTGRMNTEGGMSLLDDDGGKEAIDALKKYIDIAHSLSADIVLGWAKGKIAGAQDRKSCIGLLAKNLKIVEDYAKDRDVKINIEVINRYETNIFNTAKELVAFLKKYDLKNCFVHLDTFHMNIEETDLLDAIKISRPYLNYIHFADNTRLYPGSGMIDFKAVLKTLKEVGYENYINVECIPYPDRLTAAEKAISYLKNIEKEI